MKRLFLLLSLTLILLLAACSFPTAPAVNQPGLSTTGPSNGGAPAALSGTTWAWIGFTSPINQVAVGSPVKYSLAFQQDGTVNITADCNNALGSYQVEGQSIKIEVGPMTKAVCPPGSQSDEFIRYLENAAVHFFQDGSLYIDLAAEGGTMVFAPSSELPAGAEGDAIRAALQSNPWQWASFASAAGQFDVESPGNYQLTFHENGTIDVKADCNTASGTYTIEDIKITILAGPVTLAACPSGSRSEEFINYLGNAGTYFYQPGELFLDLAADGGTMRFTPVVPGN